MTVDEYMAKFNRLSRYFPELVPDNAKKAHKFQLVLHLDLDGRIASVRHATMNAAILVANTAQSYQDLKQNNKHAGSSLPADERTAKKENTHTYKPPPPPPSLNVGVSLQSKYQNTNNTQQKTWI